MSSDGAPAKWLGRRVVYAGPPRWEVAYHRNGVRGAVLYGRENAWFVHWDGEPFTAIAAYPDDELAGVKRVPDRARAVAGPGATRPCTYCGVGLTADEQTIDHEPPRALTRKGTRRKCLVACQDCNGLKSARTEAVFRAWLAGEEGQRWISLRRREVEAGQALPQERATFRGAPGNARLRGERQREKRVRRRVLREAQRVTEEPARRPDPDRERWA